MEWAVRMKNRVNMFCEKEEDKALLHKTRAERFTAVYLIYQALIFFSISGSRAALYWRWWLPFTISLSLSLLYFLSLLRALSSFHRIHHRLDRLFLLQHTHSTLPHDHFLYVGTGHPHLISTLSHLRYHTIMRRLATHVTVLLLLAFAAVMLFACGLLPPPPPLGTLNNIIAVV